MVYHKLIKVAISWRKFLVTEQLYIGLLLYPLLQLLSGMRTNYSHKKFLNEVFASQSIGLDYGVL